MHSFCPACPMRDWAFEMVGMALVLDRPWSERQDEGVGELLRSQAVGYFFSFGAAVLWWEERGALGQGGGVRDTC